MAAEGGALADPFPHLVNSSHSSQELSAFVEIYDL